MKKILTIIACAAFFCCSPAFGDEVDRELATRATEQIKTSTRAMINTGIKSDDAIKMTRLMLENQFMEEQTLRAHQIIMNAHQHGLPVDSIMSKAYEGMAKQVQARNIVQAMEQVHSRYALAYEQARALTQERSRIQSMGKTIAKSLAAGMNKQDLRGITNTLQNRAQQMTRAQAMELSQESFKTARDMARLGLSSKATADLVGLALQTRYTAREMKTMRSSFMAQARSSVPTHVAKSYSNAIKGGKSADSLGSSGSGGAHGGSGAIGGSGSPGGSGGPGGDGGSGGPGGDGGSGGPGGSGTGK